MKRVMFCSFRLASDFLDLKDREFNEKEYNLEFFCFPCDDSIDRDQENHDGHSGKDRRSEDHPEVVQAHAHLEWCGPQHVQVGRQFHESLCVRRHQVHNLSDRRFLSRCVTQLQGLKQGNQLCTVM